MEPELAERAAQVHVPRRTSGGPEVKRAVHHALCQDGASCTETHVPPDVAAELGLKEGAVITVTQRRVLHTDDARLGRAAMDTEGIADPMRLLQATIDRTVTDSNLGIHPDPNPRAGAAYARILIADMDAPDTAWWLYQWLGAADVMHRISTAAGARHDFKKKSNG